MAYKDGVYLPDRIVRSDRRTIGVYIDLDGTITVRAPQRASRRDIDEFVKSAQSWLAAHSERARQKREQYEPLTCEDGSLVPFLGSELTVCVLTEGNNFGVCGSELRVPETFCPDMLRAFYRSAAAEHIPPLVMSFSAAMGLRPTAVKISSAAGRWGSCSGKNSLNFSWRLIMCREELIRYVVVHELGHIKYKDHSSSFYDYITSYLPQARALDKELDQYSRYSKII